MFHKQARQESNLQPPVLERTPSNAGVGTNPGTDEDRFGASSARQPLGGIQAIDVIRIVKGRCAAIERGIIEVPPRRRELGDWGPVNVRPKGSNGPGGRNGAPVFNFEIAHYAESWAFEDGTQIMGENDKPVSRALTPSERAAGITVIPYQPRRLFNRGRSAQLRACADAVISVALDKP